MVPFLIAFVGACLILPRLGEQRLWQDEAQSALLARTVIDTGVPRGHSGSNSLSQEDGAEFGKSDVWHWHPWLFFYLVALSFKCFGQTTFAARLPSALFGIALLLLTYGFVKKRWRSPNLGLLAAAILGSNVTFVLLSRQCRFYTLSAFLALWALDAYFDTLDLKPNAPYSLFASLVLLLHTFHFFYAVVVAALIFHAVWPARKSSRTALWAILLSFAINLPWMLWFRTLAFFSHHSPSSTRSFQISFLVDRGEQFILSFVQQAVGLPWFMTALLLFIVDWRQIPFLRQKRAQDKELALIGIFVITQLVLATVLAPAPYIRYLTCILAPGAVLAALVVRKVFRWNRSLGIALLLVGIGSRPIALYAYEMAFGAQGTVDWLVEFFEQHGRPNEVVLTNYEDMPLKFYTPMRVIGGLSGEDLSAARQADWLVLLQHVYSSSKRAERIPQFVTNQLKQEDYEEIRSPFPDSMQQNREELAAHAFRTPEGPPYLILFHRIRRNKQRSID